MSEQDEYEDWPDTTPVHGAVHPATGGPEYMASTLWLPDPESRSGWSMRHVWRDEPEPERRYGFRRR